MNKNLSRDSTLNFIRKKNNDFEYFMILFQHIHMSNVIIILINILFQYCLVFYDKQDINMMLDRSSIKYETTITLQCRHNVPKLFNVN